jgi:hypothetical protein
MSTKLFRRSLAAAAALTAAATMAACAGPAAKPDAAGVSGGDYTGRLSRSISGTVGLGARHRPWCRSSSSSSTVSTKTSS